MTPWKTAEYPRYAAAIRVAEQRHGIPHDLLARLLCFDAETIRGTDRNPFGAIGIAQLTPDVVRRYWREDARRDPYHSIAIAACYLADLRECFGDWRRAVLAFRWGEDNVRRAFHPAAGELPEPVPMRESDDIARIAADVHLPI